MNLDFLTIDVGTILFTLINTLLIFLAFKHFLFGRVDAILEKRQQELTDTYAQAEDARSAASADQEKYARAIAGAKEEAAQIVSRAEKDARTKGDAILEDARAEAHAAREKAQLDTERERLRARNELQDEISGLAVELAGKILEREIDPAGHEQLIADFLSSVDHAGDEA